MHEIYLGLGSNLGDRVQLILRAVEILQASGTLQRVQVSSLYESDPVGYTDQPPFLNIVLRGFTDLNPLQLLAECQRVEQELNRIRLIRWGPRTMDVDILLYDTLTLEEPELQIPHPRMMERSFVLIPLLEICSPEIAEAFQLEDRLNELPEQGIRKLESYETTIERTKKNR